MAVQIQQAAQVGAYLVAQRLKGRKRFPLVLMLEPLFRCNLACTGCGKIQHPVEVLRQNLTPAQCFSAVEECGAPVVSIPGGEPLLHPQIDEIVRGLIDRRKFIYLCTNAILLEKSLHKFTPSPYLSFSVHLDGPREIHDRAVDRQGIFDIAVKAIQAAKAQGFRVTTNTTIFEGTDPKAIQDFFDFTATLNLDGMMISPEDLPCFAVTLTSMRPILPDRCSSRSSKSLPSSPSVWPKIAPITSGRSTMPSIVIEACTMYFADICAIFAICSPRVCHSGEKPLRFVL